MTPLTIFTLPGLLVPILDPCPLVLLLLPLSLFSPGVLELPPYLDRRWYAFFGVEEGLDVDVDCLSSCSWLRLHSRDYYFLNRRSRNNQLSNRP